MTVSSPVRWFADLLNLIHLGKFCVAFKRHDFCKCLCVNGDHVCFQVVRRTLHDQVRFSTSCFVPDLFITRALFHLVVLRYVCSLGLSGKGFYGV